MTLFCFPFSATADLINCKLGLSISRELRRFDEEVVFGYQLWQHHVLIYKQFMRKVLEIYSVFFS